MSREQLTRGSTGFLTAGCLAGQVPNSSWFQPRSTERDGSATGGTSVTCVDMSAATTRDKQQQGSAFPLS